MLDESAGYPLGAYVDVAKIGFVQRVPAVLAGVEDPRPKDSSGVVDQDRDGPELGGGLCECCVDCGAVADVGRAVKKIPLKSTISPTSTDRITLSLPLLDGCRKASVYFEMYRTYIRMRLGRLGHDRGFCLQSPPGNPC